MDYVPYLVQGIKHAFQDMGCRSVKELHERLYSGELRFEKRIACRAGRRQCARPVFLHRTKYK
jgi:hypothetical protein